ncbi:MAG TPA: LuxR C-terminal-related transcriptional regulator [Actinomycetota bacterium]
MGRLDEGWVALRRGDPDAARAVFEPAHARSPTGETFEGLARATYLELDFPRAIGLWEQSYAAYREAGDRPGAVRVARTLGGMYGSLVGDGAVCAGWIARARSLIGGEDSGEAGWVALTAGMFERDRAAKNERFREALDAGRRMSDADLEFTALAYLGASLVHDDRVDEGMPLLDEALAAVAGSEVDDFIVLEEIFCQLFAACELAHDVARADQWIRVGEAIAERRRLPAVSAFCHTHYGGVLTAAGRWPEAEATLSDAVREWDVGGRRSTLGDGALVRLADLRVRQGRFEEAEQLLEGYDVDANVESARPLAALHLALGRTALALDVLRRALSQLTPSSAAAAPLLTIVVEADVAADRLDDAERAAGELEACSARHPADDYLRAAASLARGRVCLATGTGDPDACFRDALSGFARARMPVELATTRLELAAALAVNHPEVAQAEARAALDTFERLHAARDTDAAAALLRLLGARPGSGRRSAGALTKREAEVLELLGHGLSNPEISDRLFISRKTVEHHVGNILAKLALRSRAEAAAYAARAKPASK